MINPIATLGRQRGRAVAALVMIGIGVPQLGAWTRPWIGEAVFGLLCVAFVRIDAVAMLEQLRRPAVIILVTLWTMVGVPWLFTGVMDAVGVLGHGNDLAPGLLQQAVASPMMAAPAMVVLMGLDATLVLAVLVVSTLLVPVTAPLIAGLAGVELGVSSPWLAIKLASIVFGSMLVGWLMRRLIGIATITRHGDSIDGINILLLLIFVCAVMGELGGQFLANPLRVLGVTLLAFCVFGLLFISSYFLFIFDGRRKAFAIAVLVSQRNMGLMLAATGGALPELSWMYFAVSQFPLYLSPLLLSPVVARLSAHRNPGEI